MEREREEGGAIGRAVGTTDLEAKADDISELSSSLGKSRTSPLALTLESRS